MAEKPRELKRIVANDAVNIVVLFSMFFITFNKLCNKKKKLHIFPCSKLLPWPNTKPESKHAISDETQPTLIDT